MGKRFSRNLFYRNRWFLILSAFLTISGILIGYYTPPLMEPTLNASLNNFEKEIGEGIRPFTTVDIFISNILAALLVYLSGALFGLFTAFILLFQGLFFGYTAAQYPLGLFLQRTIPHAIPEFLAIIIAGAAGFRLGSILIHLLITLFTPSDETLRVKLLKFCYQSKGALEDTICLFFTSIILFFIAAVIEVNLYSYLGI